MKLTLKEFFAAQREIIVNQFVDFIHDDLPSNSKYHLEKENVLRERMQNLVDSFIVSMENQDVNEAINYIKTAAKDRLQNNYDPDSILMLINWAEKFFQELMETNFGDELDKPRYARLIRTIATNSRLIIVSAKLNQLGTKAGHKNF